MLEWYDHPYVGSKITGNVKKIQRQLNRGTLRGGCYLITIASNGVDELDLLHSRYLSFSPVRERLPMIVGIAADRADALEVAEKIVADCFGKTGGTDVRGYLGHGKRTHQGRKRKGGR